MAHYIRWSYQISKYLSQADLICIHWGCVDAPDFSPFNGNPEVLVDKVTNPERIKVLAPGKNIF